MVIGASILEKIYLIHYLWCLILFLILGFWKTPYCNLYRVSYRDGVMEHEPRPCAAVKGTQIMVRHFSLSEPSLACRRQICGWTIWSSPSNLSKKSWSLERVQVLHLHMYWWSECWYDGQHLWLIFSSKMSSTKHFH